MTSLTRFKDITDIDFVSEVEMFTGIVVLVFYRTSCGSCKAFEPVLEQFSNLYQGQMKFVRLNTDTGGTYHSQRLRVTGEPSTYVLHNNVVQGSFVGAAHAQYFMPMMADIFKTMSERLGIPQPKPPAAA